MFKKKKEEKKEEDAVRQSFTQAQQVFTAICQTSLFPRVSRGTKWQ